MSRPATPTATAGVGASGGADDRQRRCDELSDRIGVLAAQVHMLEAELVETLGEFVEMDGLNGGGFASVGQWLSIRTKYAPRDAQRLARVADRSHTMPTLMAAARQGRVSTGCLDLASRCSTEDNESRVADIVVDCTPAQAARVLSTYRDLRDDSAGGSTEDADDPSGAEPQPDPDPGYWWRTWHDEAGRGRIDAALDEPTTALMQQAWLAARAAGERDHSRAQDHDGPDNDELDRLDDPNETARRIADAMIQDADRAGLRTRGGDRFSVQVNVDVETLARVLRLEIDTTLPVRLGAQAFLLDTGAHLTDDELAGILCDSTLQLLVHHDGVPLWMGREHRLANRHQRRAIRFRTGGSGGCEFPGCTHTRYTDIHHVREWGEDSGPSDMDNFVALCGYHHRGLHRGRWSISTDGDQRFTFTHRNGTCLGTTNTAHGPGGRPPDEHRQPRLMAVPDPPDGIDGDTAQSTTRGERMTPYALDVYLSKLLAA